MEDDQRGLLDRNESDYIDFEAPDIAEVALPSSNTKRTIEKPQRIVLKYPDGSLSHGKCDQLSILNFAEFSRP